jgi:hypothetical protein
MTLDQTLQHYYLKFAHCSHTTTELRVLQVVHNMCINLSALTHAPVSKPRSMRIKRIALIVLLGINQYCLTGHCNA